MIHSTTLGISPFLSLRRRYLEPPYRLTRPCVTSVADAVFWLRQQREVWQHVGTTDRERTAKRLLCQRYRYRREIAARGGWRDDR